MNKFLTAIAGVVLALGAVAAGGEAAAADRCTKPACWGAVGIGPNDEHGFSFHFDDMDGAVARVQSECVKCNRIEAFENTCAAFASAGNGAVGYGTGPDQAGAQDSALSACREDGMDCEVRVWACSRRAN